jgi:hypothetical protein
MKFAYLAATAAGLAALLGSCTAKPRPQPPAEPARREPVQARPLPEPPPPAADWRDRPLTPGGWVYSRESSASQALFGPPNSEALFLVRCEAGARRVLLSREGSSAQLIIRTSTGARTLAATARTEPLAYSTATLAASDRLLDEMVFSRGRFTVEAQGLPMLVLPAWPEPARVVEDCRG